MVREVIPVLGYIHRGIEKMGEAQTAVQFTHDDKGRTEGIFLNIEAVGNALGQAGFAGSQFPINKNISPGSASLPMLIPSCCVSSGL